MDLFLRPLRADEMDAVTGLHNRSERHDGVPRVLMVDELREELDGERVVLATDTRVAELDGVLAGYAYTFHLPAEDCAERCYVFGEVDPMHRGKGVGRALLGWGVQRATDQLREGGRALPKYVRVDTYDYITAAQRLYARLGFTPVRWFEELLRPLIDLPQPAEVEGVAIEAWPGDRDEELRAVRNASFADHWGSTPMSAADWHQKLHGFGARLDLSLAAVNRATGAVVAVCVNHRYEADDELVGRRDGWIDNIGTLPAWRGRGVASALLVSSMRAFAAAGLTHAALGVDAESPTGADRLYRRLGFEPVQRSITYQIEVT